MHLQLPLGRETDPTVRSARLLAIILVLAFVVANLLTSRWSHRLIYRKQLEIIRTAQNPNLIFVGASTVAGGVKTDAFVQGAKGAFFRPLNAALGAAGPPEQRLLFQYAIRSHPGIKELVLGFGDFQITEPQHTELGDLTGNRMVGFDWRFPLSEVSTVYGFNQLEQAELEGLRSVPVIAIRRNFLQYVETLHDSRYFDSMRRRLESWGLLRAGSSDSENLKNYAMAAAATPEGFDAHARAFIAHPDHFSADFESILSQAQNAGMSVVLVVMPMSPTHRAAFYSRPLWRQYVGTLSALCARRGIRFIDAGEWNPSAQDFKDEFHLNDQGAQKFSLRLGAEFALPH